MASHGVVADAVLGFGFALQGLNRLEDRHICVSPYQELIDQDPGGVAGRTHVAALFPPIVELHPVDLLTVRSASPGCIPFDRRQLQWIPPEETPDPSAPVHRALLPLALHLLGRRARRAPLGGEEIGTRIRLPSTHRRRWAGSVLGRAGGVSASAIAARA